MKHSAFLGYNQELCFAESPVSCKSHASPWDQHTNHQHNTETYADILSKNIIKAWVGWTSINLGNSRPRREQAWNVLFSFLLLTLREQQNIRIEAKQLQFQTILSLTPALVTCEWTLLIFLHSCCLGHFLPSILPTLSYVLWTQETLKNLFYHRISVKDRYFGFNSSLTSMISMFDGF